MTATDTPNRCGRQREGAPKAARGSACEGDQKSVRIEWLRAMLKPASQIGGISAGASPHYS